MKGENKSWKSYSACITLNHCLLIILIVISCVNYSHGFRQRSSSFKARVFEDYQDPLERYPKIFGDDGREFPPEDVTNKPSQEELSSTVNYPSGCSSSICVMIPTYTPFPFETSEEYIPSTVQYPNERRFTEDHNTMKTQESIWIGESTTDSTFTEANPYSEPIQRTTDYGIASTWSSVESNWPTVNCGADEFSCHSKRLCIKSHLVCDGINDCDDGSDEFECESATQTFSSDSIRMIGEPDRSQPRCAEWDPKNMACKHHKGKLPLIVFSTLNALYETSLPEDRTKIHVNETTQQINLSGISVFDYDHFDDAVFWLDTSENKIFRAPFLPIEMIRIGSGEIEINFEIDRRNIVIYGTHKIHGFVYDWMRHALIWIDDYGIRSKEFYRDETRLYRTLDPSYDRPGSITIDVKKRYIFWTNIGADPSRPFDFPKYIQRIDINDLSEQYGEPRTEKIVKTNILCPIGLAIDTKNTKVYWIDGLYGILESIGYDGTNRTILYESLPFMYELISMDILSNYLYFTDRANSTIQRININNEVKKVDTLVSVPNGPPTWVKIIDPRVQIST